MGYSKGYTMFVGWLEFLGGLFLVFRKTTILGVLMTFGVMLNIFMLNVFYDVPVKLLSVHMVLMSLFLLYPVIKEVIGFFFSRGEVVRGRMPFFDYKKASNFMLIIKVGLLVVTMIRMVHGNYTTYLSRIHPNIFIGKYNVTEQKYIKDTIELDSIPDYKKWKSVSSHSSRYLSVEHSDTENTWYEIEVDEATHYIGLKRRGSRYQKLSYTTDETGVIILNGNFYGDSISVKLKKSDKSYLLRSRKFHWMQEYPFNK